MRIIIDTDGATVKCTLSGCIPTARNPNVDSHRLYDFTDADKLSQNKALAAFAVLEKAYKE